MKTIAALEKQFELFLQDDPPKSLEVLKGRDWAIAIFRPFIRENVKFFHYRIYGSVEGSIFPNYNNQLHYCGDVYYTLNLDTNELKREEHINKLHKNITLLVNLYEIQNMI